MVHHYTILWHACKYQCDVKSENTVMSFSSPYIIIAKILLSYREKICCARLAIPCISSLDFHHEALAGLITHTFHPTLQHLFCDLPFSDSEPVSRLLRESSSISYTRISSHHDRVDYWLFLGLHITPIDTSLRFRHFLDYIAQWCVPSVTFRNYTLHLVLLL